MPCVSKCCCCCSLKYGYLAYGVICLVFRICALTTIYATQTVLSGSQHYSHASYSFEQIMIGGYLGWFIATSIALFIALKGIVEKRSILLYPYIVVLILELIALFISSTVRAVVTSPWTLIELVIVGAIDVYATICLTSLYQHMKQNEKSRPILLENIPLKTV